MGAGPAVGMQTQPGVASSQSTEHRGVRGLGALGTRVGAHTTITTPPCGPFHPPIHNTSYPPVQATPSSLPPSPNPTSRTACPWLPLWPPLGALDHTWRLRGCDTQRMHQRNLEALPHPTPRHAPARASPNAAAASSTHVHTG